MFGQKSAGGKNGSSSSSAGASLSQTVTVVTDDERLDVSGLRLLYLLSDTSFWVLRRVDSLRLDYEGTSRRFVSVDLRIPKEGVIPSHSNEKIIAPLGWVPKGPASRLDAKSTSGGVAVVGKQEHSVLVVKMFRGAFQMIGLGAEDTGALVYVLEKLLRAETSESQANVANEFISLCEELRLNDVSQMNHRLWGLVKDMGTLFSKYYLMLVELDLSVVGARTTVKYSLDEKIEIDPTKFPIGFHWVIPDIRFAHSQHVEVELPKHLQIQRFALFVFDNDERIIEDSQEILGEGVRSAHVVVHPPEFSVYGDVWVTAQPARQGLFTFTKVSLFAFFVLILGCILARIFDKYVFFESPVPSSSVSIILIAPALLLSWMSREPEHSIVYSLLGPLRKMLYLIVACLVMIAGLIAVHLRAEAWNYAWILIYLVTLYLIFQSIRVYRRYRMEPRWSTLVQH